MTIQQIGMAGVVASLAYAATAFMIALMFELFNIGKRNEFAKWQMIVTSITPIVPAIFAFMARL